MMSDLRYCHTCKKVVEASHGGGDVWCPICFDDLSYYDYQAEWDKEYAILSDYEQWSGAEDKINTGDQGDQVSQGQPGQENEATGSDCHATG